MTTRVYVGNLSHRASERDVENFFRGYGRVRDIIIKTGFAFVEFDNDRDAKDAVHDLDGRDLRGGRVIVEVSRGRGFHRGPPPPYRGPYRPPPRVSRYRLEVDNLSSRIGWQELKTMFTREVEGVTFADAHKEKLHTGFVCFEFHKDLLKALEKFQGKELNGRTIKLIDRTPQSRSPSRSRSPIAKHRSPPSEDSSRSKSHSPVVKRRSRSPPSKDSSRSPIAKHRSPPSEDRSRSKSHSPIVKHRSRSPPSKREYRPESRSPIVKRRTRSPPSKREYRPESRSPIVKRRTRSPPSKREYRPKNRSPIVKRRSHSPPSKDSSHSPVAKRCDTSRGHWSRSRS